MADYHLEWVEYHVDFFIGSHKIAACLPRCYQRGQGDVSYLKDFRKRCKFIEDRAMP